MSQNYPLKVLHINNTDLTGRAFNGFDLLDDHLPFNIVAKQAVINKQSCDSRVIPILSKKDVRLHKALIELEKAQSLNCITYPWANNIASLREFQEADVIHYHLIHNKVLSILDFAHLTTLKPSLWTIHDPWFFTGHCVYPSECNGWKQSCKPCSHLTKPIELKRDTANTHWACKLNASKKIKAKPIVASEWMRDFFKQSQIGRNLPEPDIVPFGIDINLSKAEVSSANIKNKLGIPLDATVLFFRTHNPEDKGVFDIFTSLDSLKTDANVALLTVGDHPIPKNIKARYHTTRVAWTNSRQELFELYKASNIFLMPSNVEAFGLMAIEAMASARPVIVYEGTALPKIVQAPKCGIAVEKGNVQELTKAIKYLIEDKVAQEKRGKLGQKIAAEKYSLDSYLSGLSNLYRQVLQNAQ